MKARDEAKSGRDLEELCGEDKSNMSKVDISITTNTNFLDPERFLATLANHCGLAEAMVKINKRIWDDMGNPLPYKFNRYFDALHFLHVDSMVLFFSSASK